MTTTEAVKAYEEALEKVRSLLSGFDQVEAWSPCDWEEQGRMEAFLKEHGGTALHHWVTHSSYDGYRTVFLCPPGTKELFVAEFFGDDEDDE